MQDLSLRLTGFSLVVACGFFLPSCGVQAPGRVGSVVCGTQSLSLRHASSVVVAHGLSCPAACGILFPRPGTEPTSPALYSRFFTTGPPGKSPVGRFLTEPFSVDLYHYPFPVPRLLTSASSGDLAPSFGVSRMEPFGKLWSGRQPLWPRSALFPTRWSLIS